MWVIEHATESCVSSLPLQGKSLENLMTALVMAGAFKLQSHVGPGTT